MLPKKRKAPDKEKANQVSSCPMSPVIGKNAGIASLFNKTGGSADGVHILCQAKERCSKRSRKRTKIGDPPGQSRSGSQNLKTVRPIEAKLASAQISKSRNKRRCKQRNWESPLFLPEFLGSHILTDDYPEWRNYKDDRKEMRQEITSVVVKLETICPNPSLRELLHSQAQTVTWIMNEAKPLLSGYLLNYHKQHGYTKPWPVLGLTSMHAAIRAVSLTQKKDRSDESKIAASKKTNATKKAKHLNSANKEKSKRQTQKESSENRKEEKKEQKKKTNKSTKVVNSKTVKEKEQETNEKKTRVNDDKQRSHITVQEISQYGKSHYAQMLSPGLERKSRDKLDHILSGAKNSWLTQAQNSIVTNFWSRTQKWMTYQFSCAIVPKKNEQPLSKEEKKTLQKQTLDLQYSAKTAAFNCAWLSENSQIDIQIQTLTTTSSVHGEYHAVMMNMINEMVAIRRSCDIPLANSQNLK